MSICMLHCAHSDSILADSDAAYLKNYHCKASPEADAQCQDESAWETWNYGGIRKYASVSGLKFKYVTRCVHTISLHFGCKVRTNL